MSAIEQAPDIVEVASEAGSSDSEGGGDEPHNGHGPGPVATCQNNTPQTGNRDPNSFEPQQYCCHIETCANFGKSSVPSGKRLAVLGESGEITNIRELTSEQSTSVSGVLRFCKRRVLFPYLKLLGMMGLKPLYSDGGDTSWAMILSKIYLVLVAIVLVMGYGLQVMTCFRRDNGFSYKPEFLNPPMSLHTSRALNSTHFTSPGSFLENTICSGNLFYVYLIPSILHMSSFVYMVYLYWIYDDEHLQNLMERVFIQAAHANINFFSQKRLIRRLQTLVSVGVLWILGITGVSLFHVFYTKIGLNIWLVVDPSVIHSVVAILTFSTLWQDAIQITIVISFAIQCNLIGTYAELIKGRLVQHSITLPDCMKELGELVQLLAYLNDDLALGLAPLLLIDSVYATGCIMHLIKNGRWLPPLFFGLSVAAAVLWIFIIAFPLVQAACVSSRCEKLKEMGHQVRIRPFGYQYVSQYDLDSFLLFMSNLNLKARILKIPVTTTILSIVAISLTVCIMLWGYFQ